MRCIKQRESKKGKKKTQKNKRITPACDGLILLQFLSVLGRQSWETREGDTGPVQSEEAGWKHELSVNTQFALITAIRAKDLEADLTLRTDSQTPP